MHCLILPKVLSKVSSFKSHLQRSATVHSHAVFFISNTFRSSTKKKLAKDQAKGKQHPDNRSHRLDINRPRHRHGHKYNKYRKCLCVMALICIKQHLRLIYIIYIYIYIYTYI